MYLNSVTLVGFVGADPEQRQAKGNGLKFTVFSLATQHCQVEFGPGHFIGFRTRFRRKRW